MAGSPLYRRTFLKISAFATGFARPVPPASATAAAAEGLHLATNEYPWSTFYGREGRKLEEHLDQALGEVAVAGIQGYEPLGRSAEGIGRLAALLKKHGLEMRSVYVNSTLHDPDQSTRSIEDVLAIAEKAKSAGTRIIVTNPSPIRWGGPENKTDAQLKNQAAALERLAAALAAKGLVLAYHNHDIELRNAAREFHHMLAGTDPKLVKLCLDCHWIYRGAGNSAVALFDVLKLYASRIVELHLRQSLNHVWTEVLGEGDIDYPAVAKHLLQAGVKPHLVIEQAVEKGSPHTLNGLEAHRRSREYAQRVFAGFGA